MMCSAGDAGLVARDTTIFDCYMALFCIAPDFRDAGRAAWRAPWDNGVLFRVKLTTGDWKSTDGTRGNIDEMKALFRRHGLQVINSTRKYRVMTRYPT